MLLEIFPLHGGPSPLVFNIQKPEEHQEIIEKGKQEIKSFLEERGLNADCEISYLHMQNYTWPDSSLGAPLPDQVYCQVLTRGFILTFRCGEQKITLHTNQEGTYFVIPPFAF